jgi:hypothetical protein
MGFIREDALVGKYRKNWARHHVRLPGMVSRLVNAGGEGINLELPTPTSDILCMGKISEGFQNRLGDEEDGALALVPPLRALRYLNPVLVGFLISGVGFLVADHFIGAGYACLWLGITGFRNSIADLLAFRGTRVRQWSAKNVNWNNVAQSLFWTGFSVPIMAFVKAKFDVAWPIVAAGYATTGLFYNAVKFFFVAFVNGLYIATHNKLRGFDRRVIRTNLFRTIISWPFATVFAPVGNALGLPTIVQSKIWSDVVAGFIEGGGKYFKTLRLRRRDVEEIVPRITEGKKEERAIAVLDLLYLFREEPRAKNSLRSILRPQAILEARGEGEKGEGGTAAMRLSALQAIFEDDSLDRLLIDYALTRHVKEMAMDLVRLISETLPEFRDWLAALSRPRNWMELAPRKAVETAKGAIESIGAREKKTGGAEASDPDASPGHGG